MTCQSKLSIWSVHWWCCRKSIQAILNSLFRCICANTMWNSLTRRELYSGDVDMVIVPGADGKWYSSTSRPSFSTLKYGVVKTLRGKRRHVYVAGGIVEVQPIPVTIMADAAENVDEWWARGREHVNVLKNRWKKDHRQTQTRSCRWAH